MIHDPFDRGKISWTIERGFSFANEYRKFVHSKSSTAGHSIKKKKQQQQQHNAISKTPKPSFLIWECICPELEHKKIL